MSTTNPTQQPSFSRPLHLLGDCHRRIEKFLNRLIDITQTTGSMPLSTDSHKELHTALRYFRQLPALHNADEEESLFPRLRQLANGNSPAAARARQALVIMDRLENDHELAEERHASIDAIGNRWIEKNVLSTSEVQELLNKLLWLRDFYAAHIALEDNELFPLAAQILDQKELEFIGREMTTRRGVDYDSPDAIHRCARHKQAAAA